MAEHNRDWIHETQAGVSITVHVTPRASANKVVGEQSGALKVALTAPPVDGAANKALVEFLAKALGLPKSTVILASGQTSRHKVVEVAGISPEQAVRQLLSGGASGE